MRRFYLSKEKVIEGPPVTFNSHRLQELDTYLFQGGQLAVDEEGALIQKASLCLAAGVNHTDLVNDLELVALPAVALDTKVQDIATLEKLLLFAKLQTALGYTLDEVQEAWPSSDSYRAVLNRYGRANLESFDVNNFDLSDY